MKRLSLLTLLLLTFFSCKEKEAPKYTIQGSGIEEGTVYLLHNDNKSIISAKSNGEFTLSVVMNDTTTLTLVLPDSKTIPLFAEPGITATLQPDSTLKSGWSVKGSATQALYDSISRVLDATDNIDKQKKTINEFTSRHPLSEVNVELFRRYLIDIPAPDNEHLRRAISKLGGALQDHRYFATAKKQLEKKTGNVKHRMFPTFSYNTLDNREITLGTYTDKYLLVNFWATWNNDSRKSIGTLERFRELIRSENFAILNISLDNDTAKWHAAVIGDSIIGDNVIEIKGMNCEILETFNITSLPYSVLVTPYKRIAEYGLTLDSLTALSIDTLTHKHDTRNQKKKNKR